MAKQLLGKEVTAALNEKIKANVAELQAKGVNPTLCIIRVGENPSDISYERGATKRCETLGVACEKILLPEDVSQDELLATIDKVNKDDKIHGVLLFRPLPKHLDQAVIENALAAEKARVMEAALKEACSVPMEIMEKCCEAIELIVEFGAKGSKLAISDAGVGAAFCKAALKGASLNVYINTKSMADRAYAEKLNKKADAMLEKYTKIADETFDSVLGRLK